MKKVLSFLLVCLLLVSSVAAADGNVTYTEDAGEFVFAPGSDYSLTDLFPNFKDVMPGDTLTQQITVKNEASNKVKVKIYMRSLGAHEDSVEFLSQLKLKVAKSADNKMAYMFDAAADETAQLTDWVCLGTLYSGGEVDLDVALEVPVTLDNMFKNQVGYLDWEFMIEEFPIEETDPKPPQTGDESPFGLIITAMVLAAAGLVCLIVIPIWKKRKNEEKD